MMKTDDINDQAITKDKIRDGNVTAEKLANGAVSTDKLPDGAIKTPKIADGNITTSKLAEASVVTSKIADQNVTKEKIADQSVDNSKLSPSAVTYDKVKDKAIITEKLNDRAVTTEKVEEKAITNTKLGDQSVDGRVVREASLETKHFANESVTTEKVARKSITKDKLADNAVDSSQVVDGSIGNAKLSPDSVTTEKIKDGSVTNEKVADDTLGIEKFDSELRKTIQAATGLPEDLNQMIQDVDKSVKQLHEKDTDLQSQIDDKQQQIADNDDDISLLQTRSTQMEEAIKGISASGGASQATAVTYENTESGLNSITAQGAIDELANKKLNKENISQEFGNSKDKVVSQFALPFREIESPEFIKAIVDAEDHFLFGIQLDGSIEWSKGIPAPIRAKLQEIINQCQQDKTDLLESISTLNSILNKTTIKDEEGNVLDTPFRVIENEEFIMAVVDSEDRLLFGIYRDTGKPYYPQNDMYHISQSEEFLWVILDAANHPLLGIQQDGTCWAAKAQWLDDIKAIKEALSSIDETLKTFQPKEDGKGLINLDVAGSFFYISNDEYIIAVVDAENKILAGIKYDGEPYFPNHEMYSVITNEEWLYATIDAENKVLGGFRANDGHMVVGGIDISTFITNTIIDIADIKERTNHLSTIENDEYLSVETDVDGKVIGYIAPDGSHYLYKVKSETIPTEFSHIEDPEGRTEITTDADDKLLGYREKDGTRYEHKQKVENLSVNHFSNLSQTACQDIINSLSAYGLTLENKLDFSDNIDIFIPIPRGVAVVNIIADSLATSKTQNKDAILEFWGSGIYFRKNIILNAQGQTSMAFAKKNQSFDFKDGTSIKFGDWVSQDSFHLKANADDVFCGLNNVVYKYADYVVGKTDTRANRVLRSATTSYQNASGKFKADFDDNAKCMPDGFPISLHLNGEFYGMYTWNMKKHRANYSMNKKDYASIMIDPDRLTSETFWNGTIDWSKFELKNPKTLICMDGSKYDGDNPKELIDSTSEKYDESNKDMKNTAITKSLLVSLSNAMPTVNALSSEEEKKAKFKELFDYDNLVVYFLVSNAIGNYDGLWGRNTVFTIYNSGKCGFNFYDCNAVFGREARGWYAIKPNEIEKAAGTPFEMLDVLFHTEIANEYAKLRTSNLISTDTICTFLQDWLSTIGAYSISKNLDKWNEIPSYRDGSKTYPSYPTTNGFYDSFQRCEKWVKERISFMDNYFNYNV